MSEIYLMFYQAALQLFVNYNKFLQREDPIIPIMLDQIENFIKKLFGRFIKVDVIKRSQNNIVTTDYKRESQLSGICGSHYNFNIILFIYVRRFQLVHWICNEAASKQAYRRWGNKQL